MSTLTEIEAAAEQLPADQQQELLLFLATKRRAQGNLPEPRLFSSAQIEQWIADDEADMKRFLEGAELA